MRRILGFGVVLLLTISACVADEELSAEPDGNLAFSDDSTDAAEPAIRPAETLDDGAGGTGVDGTADSDGDSDSDVSGGEELAEDEGQGEPQPTLTIDMSAATVDGRGDELVVDAGDEMSWIYEVTNVGAFDLVEIDVTDDIEGLVCTVTVAVGDTETCEKTFTASAGEVTNLSTATVIIDGTTVSASDYSGYVGLETSRPALTLTIVEVATSGARSFSGVVNAAKTSSGSEPIYLTDFLVAAESGPNSLNVRCTVETMPAGELPEYIVFENDIALNFECEADRALAGAYDLTVRAGVGGSETVAEAATTLTT